MMDSKSSEKDLLCVVSPEKAINYRWAKETKEANLGSIQIASLEDIFGKFIFMDSRGCSIEPKEKETYVRDPFDVGKFYECSFDSAKQLELNRFNHYKRVAHLLGLKKFEFKREESKTVMSEHESHSKNGIAEIEKHLKEMNLDAESFFEMEEYDPIVEMNKDRYGECYQQAVDYAKQHNLFYASDVQNLLRGREPGCGLLKKKITKYKYLSCFTSCLNLAVNLEPLKDILKINPVADKLCPNGFDFQDTEETVKTKMVSLELEFYNYEN